jgi:hypothetical protein
MKTFDLTTPRILENHICDFWNYYWDAEPANDDNNVIYFEVIK